MFFKASILTCPPLFAVSSPPVAALRIEFVIDREDELKIGKTTDAFLSFKCAMLYTQ
jgi:hypothetical protein